MNNEPSPKNALWQRLRNLPGHHLFSLLKHNWPWKLLALVCAVCLWAGLISQDASLTRERTFTDAAINVTGADSLRRNNSLIVVGGLEAENLALRMRVDIPQREYANAIATNYNPRIDLTRITEPGEQTLRVITTSSSTYGSVDEVSPATVTVLVDEYITNYRVPVAVEVSGEYPAGFFGGAVSLDPSSVAVSGPRTVVDQIARICVAFDASALSARAGTVRMALPMRFLDADGNEVQSDLLEVTSAGVVLRSIVSQVTLFPMRSLSLSTTGLITGEPAAGYRLKRVTLSPAILRAAGNADALDGLENLFLESVVDVTDAKESFTQSVRVKRSSDLVYTSADSVTVSVEIVPETISRTFDSIPLTVRGTGGGLSAVGSERAVSAVLTGPQQLLEKLRSSRVKAYVDVTDLEEGEYDLPVELYAEDLPAGQVHFIATPATVLVTLNAK